MVWAEKMMADIMRVGYFGRSFGKDGLRNRKKIYILIPQHYSLTLFISA